LFRFFDGFDGVWSLIRFFSFEAPCLAKLDLVCNQKLNKIPCIAFPKAVQWSTATDLSGGTGKREMIEAFGVWPLFVIHSPKVCFQTHSLQVCVSAYDFHRRAWHRCHYRILHSGWLRDPVIHHEIRNSWTALLIYSGTRAGG
jgi:hypothetical protein